MFTGLVEEIGTVKHTGSRDNHFDLEIAAAATLQNARSGDSICVNGVCLTITALTNQSFTFGVSPETLRRTNLGALGVGDAVNLERALAPTTRLGGHFVQGHVDGVGTVAYKRPDGDALWFGVKTNPALMPYVAVKGYIAIDGVSLTVVNVREDTFDVHLVDYTQSKVILPRKEIGDHVNLEVDILAKYVERMLALRLNADNTTLTEYSGKATGAA